MSGSYQFDVFTRHIPAWEKLLSPLAGKPGLRFLEIGSFEGRSACWLLQNILTHPTSHLTCVDLFTPFRFVPSANAEPFKSVDLDTERRFDMNIAACGAAAGITKLKGNSQFILRTLPLFHYDFIFIDGSHEPRDVLHDALLSWHLLKKDGMLIFDDYGFTDDTFPERNPAPGIDAFLSAFADEYELLSKGYQVVLRKTVLRDVSKTTLFTVPLSHPPR